MSLQVELDGGQHLAEIVVELTGDRAALGLLRLDQLSRQRLQLLALLLQLACDPPLFDRGRQHVGHRPDEVHLVVPESAQLLRVPLQHAEGPLLAGDGHRDSTLHAVLEENFAGSEARLVRQVRDHHREVRAQVEPRHQSGQRPDRVAPKNLLVPRARGGANGDLLLLREPLRDDAVLDAQRARHQRGRLLEKPLQAVALQREEAELRHRRLLPREPGHFLLGALALGDVLVDRHRADDGPLRVADGSGRVLHGPVPAVEGFDVDQFVEARLALGQRAFRGPLTGADRFP